ncbi:MAG: TatD family hydrolase [Chitinophagaceae bacterium]
MKLIDTHAHIYLDEFTTDIGEVAFRAKEKGVDQILMPAIDSTTHAAMLELEETRPELCISMMGLHPCSVKQNYMDELRNVEEWLSKRKFVAVGEIGLDFYWDISFKDSQYDAFNRQVEWALQYDIPIAIHSRNATSECIKVVQNHQKGKLKGVFHCFSGTLEQAQEIIEAGFYLGIGGVLTYKNAGLDKVIKEIDPSHVILETDAPYLTPVPFRGKRNESSYLTYVLEKLADTWETNTEAIASITTQNAEKLFGL